MKRKIHIDRKMPSKEQISSYQNFDSLLAKHEKLTKRPKYNAIKVITGLILVAIIAMLVFDAVEEEDRAIEPPFGNKLSKREFHIVDPRQDSWVYLASGTQIFIPANSLVNQAGVLCSAHVLIKASEYRNPWEQFVSGIPMDYDSAGVRYVFESAGMLDIEAIDMEGNLAIADGAIILVTFSSMDSRPSNVYEFDTVQNQWIYREKDKIEIHPPEKAEITILDINEQTLDTIEYVIKEDEHLQEVEPVDWKEQALAKQKKLIELEKARMALQKAALKEYAIRDDNRRARLNRLRIANDSVAALRAQIKDRSQEFFRTFRVNRFGIWNCDRPIEPELSDQFTLLFTQGGIEMNHPNDAVMVDLDARMLYSSKGDDVMNYSSERSNLIWFVTPDGKLAYVSKDEFKEANERQLPFEVELLDVEEADAKMQDLIRELP